jgi:hypothetical protein
MLLDYLVSDFVSRKRNGGCSARLDGMSKDNAVTGVSPSSYRHRRLSRSRPMRPEEGTYLAHR